MFCRLRSCTHRRMCTRCCPAVAAQRAKHISRCRYHPSDLALQPGRLELQYPPCCIQFDSADNLFCNPVAERKGECRPSPGLPACTRQHGPLRARRSGGHHSSMSPRRSSQSSNASEPCGNRRICPRGWGAPRWRTCRPGCLGVRPLSQLFKTTHI